MNDTDFRAQLTTIKGTTPEWLGVYTANTEGSKIINQMYELGLLGKVNIFSGYGVFQDPTYWDLANGRTKGAVNWAVAFNLASSDPLMQNIPCGETVIVPEPSVHGTSRSHTMAR